MAVRLVKLELERLLELVEVERLDDSTMGSFKCASDTGTRWHYYMDMAERGEPIWC